VRFNVIVERTGYVWEEWYRSEILAGDPPKEAMEVDWGMVKAKTEIPAGMTYELSWDIPGDAEIRLKLSTSHKKPPKPAVPTTKGRSTGQKGCSRPSHHAGQKGLVWEVCPEDHATVRKTEVFRIDGAS
jgi:hypothetical protein